MKNSTVTANASGLILAGDGTIENSTISANGAPHGGIYSAAAARSACRARSSPGNTGTDVQFTGGGR